MGENSGIEWTKHTFNGWIGCTKVGPGCDHCYAETWDARGMQGGARRWGPGADRTRTSVSNWNKPRSWNRAAIRDGERHRVFCSSLADVFDNHASIQDGWRIDLGRLIEETPYLDWMLLTKRIGNAPRYLDLMFPNGVPQNVWVGATIVNRDEMLRDGPKLAKIGAKVRFWSVEPMLGDLGEIPKGIMPELVICGGESGHGARPMHPDWARNLRDQCVSHGTAFHFKQWGQWEADALLYTTPDGQCPPPNMNVGKKAAGRLLDGRTWDEMP